MDVRIEIAPDHVRAVVKGEFDPPLAAAALGRVIAACDENGLHRVLIDGRGITTAVSESQRYELARALAERAQRRVRMAVVVSHENMFSKMLEETALQLGVDVRTTASMAEGLIYLGLPVAGPK